MKPTALEKLEARVAALEEKAEDSSDGNRLIIEDILFVYDSALPYPFLIAERDEDEGLSALDEDDIKKIVKFWRKCGADI